MPTGLFKGAIPEMFLASLQGRDTTPPGADLLLKFQYIALIPTYATNFRYHLYKDGRLYFSRNSAEGSTALFNTPLPDAPSRVVSAKQLAGVKAALKAENFFQQPPFWEVKARGGALMIVTARRGRQVHEVWYVNVNTPLTDLLFALPATPQVEPTTEEQLTALALILAEQQRQLARLREDIDSSPSQADPSAGA